MSSPAPATSRLAAEPVGTAFSCVARQRDAWESLRSGAELRPYSGLGIGRGGTRLVFMVSDEAGLQLVAWANATWSETSPEAANVAQRTLSASGAAAAPAGRLTLSEVEFLQEPARAAEGWIGEKGPMIPALMPDGGTCELRLLVAEELASIRQIFAESPLRAGPAEDAESSATQTQAPPAAKISTTAELLSRYKVSASVRQILQLAAQKRTTPARALRTESLLAAVLEQGAVDARTKLLGASAILAQLAGARGGERLASWVGSHAGGKTPSDPARTYLSRHVEGTFALAARLVDDVHTSDRVLALRHLVVAMFDYRAPRGATSGQQALASVGIDAAELRRAFLESLAESGPEEERRHWGDYLERGRPPVRRRAGFNADLSTGEDQLGIQRDVDAMAALIASVELQPPLSIGLFGNWGSGKSFFMGKLRDALTDLTRSGVAPGNGAAPDFWPNIVPIEFNAWHYIDANLWASLVTHIFEQLRQWKQPGEADKLQRARHEALANLKLAQEARSEAVKHRDAAERALEKAQKAQDDASAGLNTATAKLAALMARDVWTAVGQLTSDEAKEAREKLAELGVAAEATADSVQSVYARLQELATSGGRYRALGMALLRGRGAKAGLVALVLSIAAALGAGWLALQFSERLAPLFALVTQVAGVAVTGVAWVNAAAKRVGAALEPLERARLRIEARIKVAEQALATERAKLEREIEQQRLALQQATDSVAAADRALQAALAEAVDAYSGRYVAKFIEQRATSGDYRKHLGLVALIREDFGRLSALIIDHNRNRARGAVPMVPAGEDLAEAVAEAGDLGVNRIVLFIDDLDRCPSDRVVEVLQAIHLLLAFPLFVVVVGVDSRWVARALLDTHPTLFGRNKDGERISQDEVDEALATPGDYLEKIFQIPYRLRELDPGGTRKLLHELTKSDVAPAGDNGAAANLESATPARVSDAPAANVESPQVAEDDDEEVSEDADTPAAAVDGAQAPVGVEALRLSDRERAAMSELAPIIGRSPRATKRFVNTYRLLRATDPRLRYDFRGTMLLLALVTGTPLIAARVVRSLKADEHGRLDMKDLWRVVFRALGDTPDYARLRAFVRSDAAAPWRDLRARSLRDAWERVAQFSFSDLDEPEPGEEPRNVRRRPS